MPISRKITHSSYDILFWKIEESPEELLSILNHSSGGSTSVQAKRTAHHLAGRIAMQQLLPDSSEEVIKDEFGKPHTDSGRYHLSVSHSGDYAVAIGSSEHPVGIDIEKIGDRIMRISGKFVGSEEEKFLENPEDLVALSLIWSAKEALYKLYGRKALDFRDHLFLEPFTVSDQGTILGRIEKDEVRWQVTMRYECLDGYVLVWTSDTHREIKSH